VQSAGPPPATYRSIFQAQWLGACREGGWEGTERLVISKKRPTSKGCAHSATNIGVAGRSRTPRGNGFSGQRADEKRRKRLDDAVVETIG